VGRAGEVLIAYDADAVTKDPVRVARAELSALLRGRGALVGFLEWDFARGNGIDDHLAISVPTRPSTKIAHVGSPAQRGGNTCSDPNRR
jgi:hypothetical protein